MITEGLYTDNKYSSGYLYQLKGERSEVYEGVGLYPVPREAIKEEITEVITGFVNAKGESVQVKC